MPNIHGTETLQNVIKKAASQHNSSTFHPHVTLFPLDIKKKTVEELAEATRPIAAVMPPLSLEVDRVQVGEKFGQSVFLALKSTSQLEELRATLLKALGAPAETESTASPHASLYHGTSTKHDYHNVAAGMVADGVLDTRKDGALVVKGLGSRLDLTEIWIVNITSESPASWEVLHTEAFGGAEVAHPLPPPTPTSPISPISPIPPISLSSPVTPTTKRVPSIGK